MIALQVAAGIILAYIILVYRHRLLKAGKIVGFTLLVFSLSAIALYLVSLAWDAVSASVSPATSQWLSAALTKLGMLAVVLSALASAAIGGICLSLVFYKLRWARQPDVEQDNSFIIWVILNGAVTTSVLGLLSYSPFDIYGAVDQWSRSSGFKDGGVVVLLTMLLPWSALWLWILNKRNSQVQHSASPSEDD